MNLPEILLGGALVFGLAVLAIYYARRQFQLLKTIGKDQTLIPEEKRYFYRQIRRRLTCSALMLVLAGLLVGWFFIAQNLPGPEADEDRRKPILEMVTFYWILALLVLFGILALAGFDFMATARYGLRQRRLLEMEHRAALEMETARLRKKRESGNGAP
ncbi:MAG: hypothetical protein L0Y70_17640 [Gemmataceae bacterium]|nr:hypothetical protein [Gemmataceae bacterium]